MPTRIPAQIVADRAAFVGAGTPLRKPALKVAAAILHRKPGLRPVASFAWRLGEHMLEDHAVCEGRLLSGARMMLDVQDHGHRHILFYGVYDRPTTALFRRLARPGWTVVDVGANAGYFSLLALDLGGPAARVVAFEPNPAVAELLEASSHLNDRSRLSLVRAACGSEEKRLLLHVSPTRRNTGLSTLRSGRFADAEAIETPVVRLDEYCRTHDLRPDLVKIDVEGFEAQVLEGMSGLLAERRVGAIVCEVASGEGRPEPDRIIERINAYGYRASSISPDGHLVPPEARGLQNICFHLGDDRESVAELGVSQV